MANVVIVNTRIPYPLSNGNSLRVFNLYQEVAKRHSCYLAAFENEDGDWAGLKKTNVFREILLLPPPPRPSHPLRHIRLSDACYYRWGAPRFYKETMSRVRNLVNDVAARIVVAVTLPSAELVIPFRERICVADDYDCLTLELLRARANTGGGGDGSRGVAQSMRLVRAVLFESTLTRRFDLVTAISPADLRVLRRLNPVRRGRLALLPNGVPGELLACQSTMPRDDRAVAFWGNFLFYVNRTAARHFFERIYRPHLAARGVSWHLVGAHLDEDLREQARLDPGIVMPGFVPELPSYLERIPVMVNPMINGGGMKNKVLEAFALGMTVVTTRMGIEAIPAEDGVHCLIADTPAAFAAAVLRALDDGDLRARLGANAQNLVRERYSWRKVGEAWCHQLEQLVAARPA